MEDWRVWLGFGGFLLTLIGFVFTRAEKSASTTRELEQRTHLNELAIANQRADVAEKYATKHELREAVEDIKKSMEGRFDRLETKLDKKEREAA
ncbi:TPA: hypothetical protein NKS55_001350 [Vibrio parahaemolyticus]|uniref:hypothetical protein n=1 Tax=Vibrio TaxID=662 RepID=UPI0003592070|nr:MULTISPECIES: hypothetical protein [Vibrio harveyi group]AGQ92426.1 hypothetical protein M634_13090 [Vibrio parahaemolyticus O1:Kuk str. FDA_R31]EGR3202503.1 hypothetical protein [Vibrio parahaemolyticus]EJB0393441.1 hypothetical protein [Vibrio parahaemolyticus]EJG1286251.1 hypothetical protein [Vibrio parahaemolyticus]EJG1297925.1 hypothetical protein [Vibrio parahaemolyticus]